MRGWISVEEKLPAAGKDVLVVTDDGYVVTAARYLYSQGRDEEWQVAKSKVMYWMNLPAISKLPGVEEGKWLKKYAKEEEG